jgi:hypothetical protein
MENILRILRNILHNMNDETTEYLYERLVPRIVDTENNEVIHVNDL